MTPYQIAKKARLSRIILSRFLSGERDIRMETADKLGDALGLGSTTGTSTRSPEPRPGSWGPGEFSFLSEKLGLNFGASSSLSRAGYNARALPR